jgi:NADH dehydrogenase
MKHLTDAVILRDRALALLELVDETVDPRIRRALLTFVVVGGNYTGVEVAGEFNEFLREAARYYDKVSPDDIRLVLVDHGKRLLKVLDEDLAGYASERLSRRGVRLMMQNTVSRIEADRVQLGDGSWLPACTVIWAAGIVPPPLLNSLGFPLDERGYLQCDDDLRVRGCDNVWAVGDCAVNRNPHGDAYPPTAQHAVREGQQAADNIIRTLRGQPTRPLKYRSKGMMAPLGKHQGVARVLGWKLSGLTAWFLWRTFYLFQMPGAGRSLRVVMDWTLDWFFRRDFAQLGLHDARRSADRAGPAGRDVMTGEEVAAGEQSTADAPDHSMH